MFQQLAPSVVGQIHSEQFLRVPLCTAAKQGNAVNAIKGQDSRSKVGFKVPNQICVLSVAETVQRAFLVMMEPGDFFPLL